MTAAIHIASLMPSGATITGMRGVIQAICLKKTRVSGGQESDGPKPPNILRRRQGFFPRTKRL
ncbi:hypothetical protein FB004_102111 [Sinorhizobium medicae]|nr:hypothetical protein FB004_102111 [Sinorhizobium medicae]TWA31784.1 hypothetical protein FB007_112118 [Sinorhizobium medicae]TWA37220.1 hypothetical protein FB009_10954 [Sinorhizobium medicae]